MARAGTSRTFGRGGREHPGRGCALGWALAALVIAVIAPVAAALRGPLDILSLPADVDMALCVRDAAEAWREPSGRAARQMSDELAAGLGLPRAWNELWKSLDMPADQAIDRLLGRRVLIAWRWPKDGVAEDAGGRARRGPGDPDWVVISLVSEDTERRIRQRLRPAPREVESGQAVLSLEDGRFLLTTRVIEGDGRRGERLAVLMLAPSAHIALFKDMLPRLAERGDGPNLRDDPEVARLSRLLSADISMLSRGRVGPGAEGVEDAAGWVSGAREIVAMGAWWRRGESLAARGPGLNARIARLGPSVPREVGADVGLAPGQIDRLAEGALLAVAEMLPSGTREAEGAREVAVTLPRGPSVGSFISTIVKMMDLAPDQLAANLGPETVAIVRGSGREDDPLSLTLGVAARDLSVIAPSGDRLMATVLAAPIAPAGAAAIGPDFRGAYPPAVRSASVPEGCSAHMQGLLGEAPTVSWQFAPMAGAASWMDGEAEGPGARAGDQGRSPWAIPGWWVTRFSQGADGGEGRGGGLGGGGSASAGVLRAVSGELTSRQELRGVVIAGVIRPAGMLAALAAVGVPVPPATGAVRWIERVRWEGSLAEPGRLMIDMSIDLQSGMGAQAP